MSTWSEKNPFRKGRFYHLAIYSKALDKDSLWESLSGGLRHKDITPSEYNNSLSKAISSNYENIVFPCNAFLHPLYESFIEQTLSKGLRPIQQVTSKMLNRICNEKKSFFIINTVGLEIILEDIPSDFNLLQELEEKLPQVYFTVPGLKQLSIWQELDRWPPRYFAKTHFYFPYKSPLGRKEIFTAAQIMEIFEDFQKKRRDLLWRPPLGVDIFEDRVAIDRELEPKYKPVFSVNQNQQPLVSVVIPAYNNGKYLLNTLKHLEEQNLDKAKYEVIVVDDGSSDDTSELILAAKDSFKMAWTYLYYPRKSQRKMGDSQFRAGLARNLGVKSAQGKILAFLDSDIITPPHYLQKILDLHNDWDVVQWRRDYLSKTVDSPNVKYKDVDPKRDCFVPEDGYWHNFYEQAAQKNWEGVPDFWKYTCTYALSLSKKSFEDLGWFRKTFCFYGFEDTDLGWRMYSSGMQFCFHNEAVFHLHHPTERSEFGNSYFLRQKLLKNTARIFFNNNLSPEIYKVFKMYLKDGVFF